MPKFFTIVCCLINKLSLSKLPFHEDASVLESWQELIDDCLQHLESDIQTAAAESIPAFYNEYYRKVDGSAKLDIQGKDLLFEETRTLTTRAVFFFLHKAYSEKVSLIR